MISGDMSRIVAQCGQLREELGIHALEGCNGFNLSRRDRSLAAVLLLIAAAHECARCIGAEEAFQAVCASMVPAKGLRPGIITPDQMQ